MIFQTNSDFISPQEIIAYSILGIWFCIMLYRLIPFWKNRREYLFLLDLSVKPMTLKKLGFIMHEIKQNTHKITTQKGAFSKKVEYYISKNLYELKNDFKLFTQKNSYLIIGSLGEKSRGMYDITVALTEKQFNMIKESNDILGTLNQFVKDVESAELEQFKNVAKSSSIVIERVEEVKNQIIGSMSGYTQGLTDGITLFCDAFGLDPDEIDYDIAQEIIDKRHLKSKPLTKEDMEDMLSDSKFDLKDILLGKKKKKKKGIKIGED